MKKKICFAASSGGHFEQIMMLSPLIKKYSSFLVTEKTQYKTKIDQKIYFLPQLNRREPLIIFKFLVTVLQSLYVFIKERPNIYISTGALSTIPLAFIIKAFRGKVIFIESFAKVSSPTYTGRLLYKIADRFYIQWKGLQKYYPKAIYLGGIY